MSKEVFGFDANFLKSVKSMFKETNIQEIEIEEGEYLYLRVSRKKEAAAAAAAPVMMHAAPVAAPAAAAVAAPAPASSAPAAAVPAAQAADPYADEAKYAKIKSPIVGTFYESPAPSAPAFVKTGDQVSPDTVVCIVEAMKAMNEIRAEVKGKIVAIKKSNGDALQAGDVMFVIEKA